MKRKSALSISSADDPAASSADHNSANFQVKIPNTNKLEAVSSLCFQTVCIPRMFDTITEFNDTLIWWRRRVLEEKTAVPDRYLRTLRLTWTPVRTLRLPRGIKNMTDILTVINAAVAGEETWSYDSANRTIVIQTSVPGAPYVYGYFDDPGHVEPPEQYANHTYLTSGGTDAFELLGIQRAADIATVEEDKKLFDPLVPNTFDTVRGSNLENVPALPLFDRFEHTYVQWASVPYTTPPMNAPNISGPTVVHVTVPDMADTSMVHGATGVPYPTLTSVNMDQVEFGRELTHRVRDADVETLSFVAPRTIRSFAVSLRDHRFRPLRLPRNYPVHLVVEANYTDR